MEFQALDPNHEIMLESIRRQASSSLVLRRHDDLRRQCEKEMSSYDRAKRLTAAECRRAQLQHMNRLKTLLHYSSRQTDRRRPSRPSSSYDVSATETRRHSHVTLDHHHGVNAAASGKSHGKSSLYDVNRVVGGVGSTKGGGGGDRKRARSAPVSAYSCQSAASSSFTGRERFLFRVLSRNGKEVYIRDESEARESRQLLNGTPCDDFLSACSVPRTRSGRP